MLPLLRNYDLENDIFFDFGIVIIKKARGDVLEMAQKMMGVGL